MYVPQIGFALVATNPFFSAFMYQPQLSGVL
jgi:hypothetical protein